MTKFSNCLLLAAIICWTAVMTHHSHLSDASPILGLQTEFDDNSKIQGKSKPILVHCDEIGNHFNCIVFCKNMGHMSGNCQSDFTCSCF